MAKPVGFWKLVLFSRKLSKLGWT